MRKNIITLVALTLSFGAFAQIGTGFGTKKPSPAAILEVKSENKGVLIPRIELKDLNTFGLAADTKDEGMLIYNSTEVKDASNVVTIGIGFYYWTNKPTGGQWEKVTSQSVVNNLVDRITVIESTTGSGETGGGTVVYIPGEDGKPGKLVIIDKTNGSSEIPLDEILLGNETETFFKVVEVEEEVDNVKKTFKKLHYFGEEAISKWILKDPKNNKREDAQTKMTVTDDKVAVIDITSVVSSNFERIVEDNKKVISETINKLDGSVSIKDAGDGKGYYFEVKKLDAAGDPLPSEIIYFNSMETKTSFVKTIGDAATAIEKDAKVAPTEAELKAKGSVVYKFLGEEKDAAGNPIPYYINATSDFLEIVKNNETIQKEITKVVNTGGGTDPGTPEPVDPTKPDPNSYGNVYYGDVNKDGNPILYTVNDGKTYAIDISQNILNEITNNQDIIEKLKEQTTVVVKDGEGAVNTGEVINGFQVKKLVTKVTVEDTTYGYDSTFKTAIPVGDSFARLLKATVLKGGVDGQLVADSATEVVFDKGAKTLKFSFGVGEMYTPVFNGDYDVILEFISTEAAPTK
ncbi:hypothetical protein NWE55_16505 [Myroides albus]|uniref:hypothetical protein n=1 Tax=Myroides albus TaxID=2562892 RepID=UPI002158C105|nr:hypothetical protein [Myroides albus]UVD79698.1 hypothetical protein NWE55_16505 [Myroides albus]